MSINDIASNLSKRTSPKAERGGGNNGNGLNGSCLPNGINGMINVSYPQPAGVHLVSIGRQTTLSGLEASAETYIGHSVSSTLAPSRKSSFLAGNIYSTG